jgi:hypothetical protein
VAAPLASFKDLCIDVNDVSVMGPFWASTLGLTMRRREDGQVLLVDDDPHHTVWLNEVPEPVTVKQRVHLDVHTTSTAEILARGASPEDTTSFRWDVLHDPEGGELCAFTRDVVPAYRLYEIIVDSAAERPVCEWWAEVLGATAQHDEDESGRVSWIEDVPGMPFELIFSPVPEPKAVKNRIHWDVDTPSIDALVAHGARVLEVLPRWTVLADPEGNEFCAFEG